MASKLVFYQNYYRKDDNKIITGQLLVYFIDVLSNKDAGYLDMFTLAFWEGDSLFFSKDVNVDSFNEVLKEALSICDKHGITFEIAF